MWDTKDENSSVHWDLMDCGSISLLGSSLASERAKRAATYLCYLLEFRPRIALVIVCTALDAHAPNTAIEIPTSKLPQHISTCISIDQLFFGSIHPSTFMTRSTGSCSPSASVRSTIPTFNRPVNLERRVDLSRLESAVTCSFNGSSTWSRIVVSTATRSRLGKISGFSLFLPDVDEKFDAAGSTG